MANDELKNNENNERDISGLESDSLDALDSLDKISADEIAETVSSGDADSSLSSADELFASLKLNEDDLKLDADLAASEEPDASVREEAEEQSAQNDEPASDGETSDTAEAQGHRGNRPPQRRRRPPQGANRRPDGKRRPDGRPGANGRPAPNGRKRPVGEQGKRASGAAAAAGAAGQTRRPRPKPGGEQTGTDAKGKKGKKGWSKKKKTVLITVVTIVLTVLLIVGVILFLFFRYTGLLNRDPNTTVNSDPLPLDSSEIISKPDTIDVKDQEEKLKEMLASRSTPISNENVMNILLVGEDLRDTTADENGQTPRGNTDVQLLVSINKEKKKIVLSSFLRDSYVYLDNYGNTRLNAAYYHEGMPLLESTISQYFDIKIDRYVMVNFYSFIDIVENIGGIDVDVDKDELAAMTLTIREQNFLQNYTRERDAMSSTGMQHLNGNQALAYARVREGCGDDYGRTQRQREVITEVIKKIKNLSIMELDSLITTVAPQITTDVSNGEIASLILSASEIAGYQVCQIQMPTYPYFKEEVINQMAVLVPDYDKNAALLKEMVYGDSTTSDEAVKKLEAGQLSVGNNTTDQNNNNTIQNNKIQNNDPTNIAINSFDYTADTRKKLIA